MPYIIRHIAVGSAFKVGLAVSALMAGIFGLLGLLIQASLMGLISSAVNNSGNIPGGSGNFATFGLASSCIFYGVSVVMAALFGGIGATIAAFVYNLAAGWFGGLQIELSTPNVLDQMGTGTPEKRKNIYEQ